MKKRIFACFLSVLLLGGVLGGCQENAPEEVGGIGSEEANATKKPISGGQLVIGTLEDLDGSLDPYEVTEAGVREILFNVYEGLVKADAKGDYVPAVAQEVTAAEDGMSYTFFLREDVRFHDGTAVTTEDVIASFTACQEKAVDPGLVQALDNVLRITEEEGAVTVTLRQADPSFLSYVSLVYIVPAEPAQEDGEDQEDQTTRSGQRSGQRNRGTQDSLPVGTGPFQVSQDGEDQGDLELTRFDGYWGETAYLDKVTFRSFSREERLMAALEEGSVDMALHLTQEQLASVSANVYKVLQGSRNQVQALYLNSQTEPFDNEQVRQAIRCAVDVDGVLSRLGESRGTKVDGPIYPAMASYYDESLTSDSAYDVERAKELLAGAGYEDGFSMTITVPTNDPIHEAVAQVLADQLAEVNIRVTVRTVSWETWISRVYTGREFEATVVSFASDVFDAKVLLAPWASDSEGNFSGYEDPQYDRLLEQAAGAAGEEERISLYQQAAQRLTENAAGIFIQDLADFAAMRTYVDGYQFYSVSALNLAGLYFVQSTGSAGGGEP